MTAAHQKMTGKKAAKGEMSAADKIKMFDTNGDGVLTADEHAAAAKTMFDKMDTDHDSYLTKAEVKAGHEKYMRKTQAGSSRPAISRSRAKRESAAISGMSSRRSRA